MNKKTVLITGSSRGIGLEIAKKFKEKNFELILPNRTELDLSCMESVKKYCENLEKKNINIDILINNAGINELLNIDSLDASILEKMFNVNLFSSIELTKACVKGMKKNNNGKIVNISSILSAISKEKRAMYSMTKSAIDSFTRTCAIEYGMHNILVNSICPGYIRTDLTFKNNSESDLKKIIDGIPLKRMGEASEIAELVLFLASDKNTYISGQSITIDGGKTIYVG